MNIRPMQADDIDTVKDFTVRAFIPIFESFKHIMGNNVFPHVYPDWKALHRSHVDTFYNNDQSHVYVADIEGVPVGLIVYRLDNESNVGEIEFLVVDPDHQGNNIATELNEFALSKLKDGGMKVASVSTGGDPSHQPARNAYEKVGFIPLSNIWYFKSLED